MIVFCRINSNTVEPLYKTQLEVFDSNSYREGPISLRRKRTSNFVLAGRFFKKEMCIIAKCDASSNFALQYCKRHRDLHALDAVRNWYVLISFAILNEYLRWCRTSLKSALCRCSWRRLCDPRNVAIVATYRISRDLMYTVVFFGDIMQKLPVAPRSVGALKFLHHLRPQVRPCECWKMSMSSTFVCELSSTLSMKQLYHAASSSSIVISGLGTTNIAISTNDDSGTFECA